MKRQESGITLIELMITVAVVSILAAIAYPSYRSQVIKSNRTEAKAALSETAQTLQRCYTRQHSFAANASTCNWASPFNTPGGLYSITIAVPADGQSFLLTATPLAGQQDDTRCANLTLTDTNVRGKTGTAAVSECW